MQAVPANGQQIIVVHQQPPHEPEESCGCSVARIIIAIVLLVILGIIQGSRSHRYSSHY